jgi:hypothetical protein
MGGARWSAAQRDHGHNATPAWEILGTTVAKLAPASDATIRALALLDAGGPAADFCDTS